MTHWKSDCVVAGMPGVASIVEQVYDEHFRVWYGCIDLDCPIDQAHALQISIVSVMLPDGRSFAAKISKVHVEQVKIPKEGEAADEHVFAYFVALSPAQSLDEAMDDLAR